LNYAVSATTSPIWCILCGVEKAVNALPEEAAEEIQQESVKILKGSCKPRNNLMSAERRCFQAIKDNAYLAVLTDSGNTMAVLNTADYNQRITALLEDQAYKKLNMYC
jgi:hypothetical protein